MRQDDLPLRYTTLLFPHYHQTFLIFTTMIDYNKQFDAAYQMLNTKQQEAVDHIYGPVLTLAGPGTGKTQLLTVRIGHIVRTTDTDIRNILCLTYTDAGAHAMRKRLQSFIGPDAYNANIYTYHAFCNDIIRRTQGPPHKRR